MPQWQVISPGCWSLPAAIWLNFEFGREEMAALTGRPPVAIAR